MGERETSANELTGYGSVRVFEQSSERELAQLVRVRAATEKERQFDEFNSTRQANQDRHDTQFLRVLKVRVKLVTLGLTRKQQVRIVTQLRASFPNSADQRKNALEIYNACHDQTNLFPFSVRDQ